MELLAGSMNVEVEEFLHAGYLSASPRSLGDFGMHRYYESELEVVDLPAAVALKPIDLGGAETASAEVAQSSVPSTPLPAASLTGDLFAIGLVVLFFAAIAAVYLRRMFGVTNRWLCFLFGGPLLVLGVVAVALFGRSAYESWQIQRLNNLPPPWQDVAVREYEQPELATRAIIYGLIADGLNGCSFNVQKLSAIRNEVAWPLDRSQWTEGMEYAAMCYGRDGWGNEFQFEPLGQGVYRIASAGADEKFGSADDIVFMRPKDDTYNWEQQVASIYMQPVNEANDKMEFLVHRVAHRNFRVGNKSRAAELTGSQLYDAVHEQRWLADDSPPPFFERLDTELENLRSEEALADGSESPRLLLLIVTEKRT